MVHAVLRRLAPRAVVVDLTHDVPALRRPGRRGGALPGAALPRSRRRAGGGRPRCRGRPAGRGPAGARRPGPRWLVGPDNGLLVPAARAAGGVERAVGLPASDHGRGRPARGRPPSTVGTCSPRRSPLLCDGADLAALGVPLDPATLVEVAEPVIEARTLDDGRHRLRAEVTWVDRFGNVQLAAAGDVIPGAVPEVSVTVRAGRGDPRTVALGSVPSPISRPASRGCWSTPTAVWRWWCGRDRRRRASAWWPGRWWSSSGDRRCPRRYHPPWPVIAPIRRGGGYRRPPWSVSPSTSGSWPSCCGAAPPRSPPSSWPLGPGSTRPRCARTCRSSARSAPGAPATTPPSCLPDRPGPGRRARTGRWSSWASATWAGRW